MDRFETYAMTRTIQLDMPETLYEAVVKAASANGTTAEEWILENATARLPSQAEPSKGTTKKMGGESDPFRDSFGMVHSGNPRA